MRWAWASDTHLRKRAGLTSSKWRGEPGPSVDGSALRRAWKRKWAALSLPPICVHPAVLIELVVLRQHGGRSLSSVVQPAGEQLQVRWATVGFSLVESK